MQRHTRGERGDGGAASAQNRMATLLLLAKGREPSWSRLRQQPQIPISSTRRSETSHSSRATTYQSSRYQFMKVICCLWLISVTVKVLVFPAYHSTDFDVHRHWKAVTLHIPTAEWYYDDKYVNTRHTLDYPPAFALMEYSFAVILSRIQRVSALFSVEASASIATCLSLRDDVTVEAQPPSYLCVALMRSTVVLFSDFVYWLGSGAVAWTIVANGSTRSLSAGLVVFALLVGHPALLWLDHVHFQYNGLLLGVLFLSLAALLHANNVSATQQTHAGSTTGSAPVATSQASTSNKNDPPLPLQQHWCHLSAAAAFTLLVSLKHLYVTSCLWYGLYLLRRYCCASIITHKKSSSSRPTIRSSAGWVGRFLALAVVAFVVAAIPLAVFVAAIRNTGGKTTKSNVLGLELNSVLVAWMTQLWRRLFPFGRGLVHSYWAGNVWALVIAAHKVMVWIATRLVLRATDTDGKMLLSHMLQSVQIITPSVTAVCMVLVQVPGLYLAWQAAAERSNAKLLQSFTMAALGTFLFQYHAHEKAILTALLPGTLWACHMVASASVPCAIEAWYIVGEFTAYSLLGIFPLLFQRQEFLLKLTSSIAYVALWYALAPTEARVATSESVKAQQQSQRRWRQQQRRQWTSARRLSVAVATMVQLEVLAPLGLFGRYEFAPLAVTSLVCAVAFIHCFIQLYQYKS